MKLSEEAYSQILIVSILFLILSILICVGFKYRDILFKICKTETRQTIHVTPLQMVEIKVTTN